MRRKKTNQSRNRLYGLLWVVIAVSITFAGCAAGPGPILLNRAVRGYDDRVLNSEEQLLLLNIIRMHYDQPPHFTVSSEVKATFTLSSEGLINPLWSNGPNKNSLGFSLKAAVSDSPTITIAPMQGKEFTTRLLKPIDTGVAETGFFQRAQQIDKLLRLIGHSFLMISPEHAEGIVNYPPELVEYLSKKGCFVEDEDCSLVNRPPKKCEEERPTEGIKRPTDKERYELFRQVVLQIKATQMNRELFISPLEFDEEIEGTFTKGLETKDAIEALGKQYRWEAVKKDTQQGYVLKKRHIITGLVDSELEDQECKKIAKTLGLSDYIKYDYPVIVVRLKKSNWPIYGLFRLRSFRQVLQFLGESLKDQCEYQREYYVAPSPFTEALAQHKLKPKDLDNPPLTLTITSGKTSPGDSVVDVDYNGESFWVSDPSPPDQTIVHSQWDNPQPLRWNKQVFSILYEIFQMNRVEPAVSPTLTSIAK